MFGREKTYCNNWLVESVQKSMLAKTKQKTNKKLTSLVLDRIAPLVTNPTCAHSNTKKNPPMFNPQLVNPVIIIALLK